MNYLHNLQQDVAAHVCSYSLSLERQLDIVNIILHDAAMSSERIRRDIVEQDLEELYKVGGTD